MVSQIISFTLELNIRFRVSQAPLGPRYAATIPPPERSAMEVMEELRVLRSLRFVRAVRSIRIIRIFRYMAALRSLAIPGWNILMRVKPVCLMLAHRYLNINIYIYIYLFIHLFR